MGGMTIDLIGMSGIDHALCTVLKTYTNIIIIIICLYFFIENSEYSLLAISFSLLNSHLSMRERLEPTLANQCLLQT